jgi:hypothetical protein
MLDTAILPIATVLAAIGVGWPIADEADEHGRIDDSAQISYGQFFGRPVWQRSS